jgi:hypothetical protein
MNQQEQNEYIERLTEEIKNVVDIELGVVSVMPEKAQSWINEKMAAARQPSLDPGDLYFSKTTIVTVGNKGYAGMRLAFPDLDVLAVFTSKKYSFDVAVLSYESNEEIAAVLLNEEFHE